MRFSPQRLAIVASCDRSSVKTKDDSLTLVHHLVHHLNRNVKRNLARSFVYLLNRLMLIWMAQPSIAWSNPVPLAASIVSDGSLPNPSVVQVNEIIGGTRSGNNVFHSFEQFSIPLGQTAIFKPDSGIQNIIARVTGKNRSILEGEIQAPSNIFLMNPNGITFGPQATLNITGSFLATTAPILQFRDGKTFSSDRTIDPILSVNLPVGIQWGSQPSGDIQNFGGLVVPESLTLIAPKIEFNQASAIGQRIDIQSPTHLVLNESQLTTQNGGELTLQVGDLNAQSSLIASSYFTSSNSPLAGKLTIQGRGDLRFDQLSFVEAKTFPGVSHRGNDIEITGRSIFLQNGSMITTQSLGAGNAGNIHLTASDRIELLDTRSGLLANFTTISSATYLEDRTRSGDITLLAPNITIGNQALVQSVAVTSSQQTGNIHIQADDRLTVDNSIISSFDLSNQQAGAIVLDASTVQILNGSWIESNVFNNGQGSMISILGRDQLLISDKGTYIRSQTFGPGRGGDLLLQGQQITVSNGAIVSTDSTASGAGGQLWLEGQTINILEGGQLRSASSGDGNSGNIQVKASKQILIKDKDIYDPISAFLVDSINTISSNVGYIPASQLPPNSDPKGILLLTNPLYSLEPIIIPVSLSIALNQKYTGINASSTGNGKAGNIDIQSPLVNIQAFSLISNASIGLGDSAKISIQAQQVNMENSSIIGSTILANGGMVEIIADTLTFKKSNILTSTVEGNGGIVTLNIRDLLTLKQDSNITARAANLGQGGIITINNRNGFIVAEANRNNDILATASRGKGGIISIRSAGIFNLIPRQIQTTKSDLLASSDTGIQGSITLTLAQQKLDSSFSKLPDAILDRSNYIIPSCPSIVRDNRLIVTGQGGRMPTASEMVNLLSLEIEPTFQRPPNENHSLTLIEATHWQRQADGSLSLLPSRNSSPPLLLASCLY